MGTSVWLKYKDFIISMISYQFQKNIFSIISYMCLAPGQGKTTPRFCHFDNLLQVF